MMRKCCKGVFASPLILAFILFLFLATITHRTLQVSRMVLFLGTWHVRCIYFTADPKAHVQSDESASPPPKKVVLVIKNLPANAGDIRVIRGLNPGSGRSPGGGPGNLLWCSHLGNPHGQRSLESYSP